VLDPEWPIREADVDVWRIVVLKIVGGACLASQILAMCVVPCGAFADSQRLWLGGLKGSETQAFIPEGADYNALPRDYRGLIGRSIFLLGQDAKRETGKVVRIDESPGACLPSIDLREPLTIARNQFFLGSTEVIKVAPSREIKPDDERISLGLLSYLHGLGIPVTEVKVIRAVAADLDGDGRVEAVVEAMHPNRDYLDGSQAEQADDFSGVAVGELTATDFIVRGYAGYTSSISVKGPDQSPPAIFSIVALPDVQGTGKFGIAVANDGYEWRGITFYDWSANGLRPLESAYCGL
jgi:hypothetical protein